MARRYIFGLAFTSAEVNCYGPVTGAPTISGGVLSFPLNGAYQVPRRFGNVANPIGMFQCKGWRCADEGSGTGEVVVVDYFVGTNSGFTAQHMMVTRVRVDGTNFKMRVRVNTTATVGGTILATGSTLFAWATYYLLQVAVDASSTTVTLELKMGVSTLAIEISTSTNIPLALQADFSQLSDQTGVGSTNTMDFKPCIFYQETNRLTDDLDITTLNTSGLLPTKVGAALYEEFNSLRTPAQTDANAYLNLDDWAPGNSQSDGATTYVQNAGNVNVTYRQGVLTTPPTITNPIFVAVMANLAFSSPTKTETMNLGISDTVSFVDGPTGGYTGTAYQNVVQLFTTNADKTSLNQSGLNVMQIYEKHLVGAEASNGNLSALQGEVFGALSLYPVVGKATQVKQAVKRGAFF